MGCAAPDCACAGRDLTVGTIDHGISTLPGRTLESWAPSTPRNLAMQRNCEEFGVRLFSIDHANHGIVHVVGPHLGFALPGCTYVCGDSHTASCGGVGAWAWGIGTSEVMQVFATQALDDAQAAHAARRVPWHAGPRGLCQGHDPGADRPLRCRCRRRARGAVCRAGDQCAADRGAADVSNMSIEFGARGGIIAADDTTFEYLHGRPMVPKGALWDQAVRRLARAVRRNRRRIRPGHRHRLQRAEAAGDLGQLAAGRDRDRRGGARSRQLRRRRSPGAGGAGAGLHGPDTGRADRRHEDRHRVHRLMHQRTAVRSDRRRPRSRVGERSRRASRRWWCRVRRT